MIKPKRLRVGAWYRASSQKFSPLASGAGARPPAPPRARRDLRPGAAGLSPGGGGAPEQQSSRWARAPISSPYEMKFHRGIRKEMRPGRSVLLGPPPFLSRGHGF